MNRREFINASVIAGLMSSVLASRTFAQLSRTSDGRTSTAQVPGLDAYSRYLHWLRQPAEIAEACRELTCNSLMLTVGDGNAHVSLDNVTVELPRFVNALRNEGIEVYQIRGGNQTEVDADVERLAGTMSDLGITTYWLGTDRYDFSQPVMLQLDAIKRKVERFVALNERYGTKIQYHTRSGAVSVGNVVWDLLYVMGDFDPQYVGLHWDTGHMSSHGPMWETLLRTAAPYIATISWKDRKPVQSHHGMIDLPQAPLMTGSVDAMQQIQQLLDSTRYARGMGWSYTDVAIGTGWVDSFRYGEVLQEMGYSGLMDLQAEYGYPLGGASNGSTELGEPREVVMGAIKRDVLTVRTALAQSGIVV